jgi:hypothetical protein
MLTHPVVSLHFSKWDLAVYLGVQLHHLLSFGHAEVLHFDWGAAEELAEEVLRNARGVVLIGLLKSLSLLGANNLLLFNVHICTLI